MKVKNQETHRGWRKRTEDVLSSRGDVEGLRELERKWEHPSLHLGR